MLAVATPNPIVSKICDFLEVLFFLDKSVSPQFYTLQTFPYLFNKLGWVRKFL
jgi:hypothetical protein